MKKLKELRLPVGTSQPDFPGSQTSPSIGYGGMSTNADTGISRRMQSVFNPDYFEYDLDEESSEEEDMILEKRVFKKGKFSLLESLNAINEVEDEESFEEIDLEEYSGAGAVGGYALRLGDSNKPKSQQKDHHKLFEKEEAIKEQIERMRILESYHQKTSNKLK